MNMVCDDLVNNKDITVSSLSLKSVADAYKLNVNKNSIIFTEQRDLLLTHNSNITDLLVYGMMDCVVLKELADKL